MLEKVNLRGIQKFWFSILCFLYHHIMGGVINRVGYDFWLLTFKFEDSVFHHPLDTLDDSSGGLLAFLALQGPKLLLFL